MSAPASLEPSLSPSSAPDWRERVTSWLWRNRWLIAIVLATFAVRLHWNLYVHPPGDYVYSDMNGYVSRADRMLKLGLKPHEYSSFFPYGTHWLVAGMKYLFGKENYDAIGVLYALFGAFTASISAEVRLECAARRQIRQRSSPR